MSKDRTKLITGVHSAVITANGGASELDLGFITGDKIPFKVEEISIKEGGGSKLQRGYLADITVGTFEVAQERALEIELFCNVLCSLNLIGDRATYIFADYNLTLIKEGEKNGNVIIRLNGQKTVENINNAYTVTDVVEPGEPEDINLFFDEDENGDLMPA